MDEQSNSTPSSDNANDQGEAIKVNVNTAPSTSPAMPTDGPAPVTMPGEQIMPESSATEMPNETMPTVEPAPINESTPEPEPIPEPTAPVESEPLQMPTSPVEAPADVEAQAAPASIDTAPSTDVADVAAPVAAAVAAQDQNMNQTPTPSAPHPHRNNKKLAMLITVLAALLLAGATLYVYFSTNQNAEEAGDASQTEQADEESQEAQVEAEPATAEDVEAEAKAIDNAINALDDAELNEADISDTTLGL